MPLRVSAGSIVSTLRAHRSFKFLARATNHHTHFNLGMASSSSGTELEEFSSVLSKAKKITVLTGAGISAESGIPTFRGAGGLWRTWSAMVSVQSSVYFIEMLTKNSIHLSVPIIFIKELATPEAFAANPSLVWEFYHYRRCVVANSTPNFAHYALAMLQQQCENEAKHFTIITQNIDGLHWKAGSKNVVELHGSLWKTQCCRCDDVQDNYEKAVCLALDGKGAPDPHTKDAQIPVAELPHCWKCNGLLRPHVVWFGECLDPTVLDRAENALIKCDLLLVVGTSAVVQPAAGFAPIVQGGGGIVAEFNIEDTPISRSCRFKFHGPSAKTLPQVLGMSPEDLAKHKSQESN